MINDQDILNYCKHDILALKETLELYSKRYKENGYIRRRDAIEAIRSIDGFIASMTTAGHETIFIDKTTAQIKLMLLPSVDLAGNSIEQNCTCSVCDEVWAVSDDGPYFCLNCGADMRDEKAPLADDDHIYE